MLKMTSLHFPRTRMKLAYVSGAEFEPSDTIALLAWSGTSGSGLEESRNQEES
eukprot:CAMPEP_0179003446 /NCGR_PEP_ID=MMETSP0795-20121207/12692_1 /TAXON_ID=88552 /ORGANISM="Amoebophrya sp., Strain Ameob2" /LENGTH=52 /DNA_ID=CAMNT_0020697475 /DNA_START=37 /DNA_END=192 /DNA_ORIENTATION=-